jgi:hypothetical protein
LRPEPHRHHDTAQQKYILYNLHLIYSWLFLIFNS